MQKIPISIVNNADLASPVNAVLDNISENLLEIEVLVTTDCNLRCKFCSIVNIKDYPGLSAKRLIAQYDSIKTILKKTTASSITITLYGGEIFSEALPANTLAVYDDFLTSIEALADKYNKNISFTVMTNLLCTYSLLDVIALCKKHNIQLHASFDLDFRFTKLRQKILVLENLKKLTQHGIKPTISMLLSKKCIERFKSNNIVIKYLYKNYPILFSIYDGCNMPEQQPSSKDLYEFYILLYNKYPDIQELKKVLTTFSNNKKVRDCNRALKLEDSKILFCCNNRFSKEREFIKNKSCFCCKYFSKCRMTCFRLFYADTFCYLKGFLDYVSAKQNN